MFDMLWAMLGTMIIPVRFAPLDEPVRRDAA